MTQPPRTSRPPLHLLPATLAVGAAVFGAAVVGFVLAGTLPPTAAAPALLAGATLGGAAALLALVLRRVRRRGRALAAPAPAGRLELVALGDGQAAVLIEEAPGAPRRPRVPGADAGEASAAAAAIWDAVGVAVRAASAEEADRRRRDRSPTDCTETGWLRRLHHYLKRGSRGARAR